MITRHSIPSALCALACLATATLRAEDVDASKVAATVNGEPITVGEVTMTTVPSGRRSAEARQATLEKLIDKALLVQAMRKKMPTPPNDIVEGRVQEIVKDSFNGDSAAFEATLQKQGYTLELFKKVQEAEILVQVMRRQIYGAETNPVSRDEQVAKWLAMARAEAAIVYYEK